MRIPGAHFLRRVPVSPVICFGLAWLLGQTEAVRRIEWRTLDWRTNFRVSFQPPPDARVAIVLFGDDTDANLAPWPTDRSVHADMIKLLTLARPKVVTWDVILDAHREGEGDALMGRAAAIAMRMGVKVITAGVSNSEPVDDKAGPADAGPTRPLKDVRGDISLLVGDNYAFRPFPELRRESFYGFADTPKEKDGLQREIPLAVRIGREVYPSFALQTLMAFFDVPADAVRVRLGDAIYLPTRARGELRLPVSADGRFLLNYRYDQEDDDKGGPDFMTFEYIGAMVKLNARFVDRKLMAADVSRLAGGIVFIGQTVTGKADAGPTPRSAYAPLVLVHANLVNNVLANDYARIAPPWAVWLGAVVVGYGGVVLGLRRSIWVLAAFTVLTVAAYVTATFAVWIKFSLWLPFAAPLTGFGVLQFVVIGQRVRQEQRGREQVKQMFGTYLSPELLKKMMKGGKNVAAVSSERRPVTIMFSDLRDFTSLTERLGDDELIGQLNEYLGAMVECIHQEGGTLHKFIGDAVMAAWGDLESAGAAADAARALRAALAMQARLAVLNEKWRIEGKPAFRMGIGVNHGVVLIGNIGSPRRMEFTAIGDAVNLASRLESLNKELKTTILVGENVRELAGADFQFRPCGGVPVKGKAKPVEVFELLGAAGGGKNAAGPVELGN